MIPHGIVAQNQRSIIAVMILDGEFDRLIGQSSR